ncbi:MAG: hypothetical protein L0027_15285, partial [Candidatus Rokubacteria bacterium]|nr:hypothetical protein [Candidatus Rokubacteria bacterium]
MRPLALLSLFALLGVARPASAQDAGAFLDRLEAAWKARDAAAYLALWDVSPEAREAEAEASQSFFTGDETRLTLKRPMPPPGATRVEVHAEVFFAKEPRARVADWRFELARRDRGWAIVARDELGAVDG